MYVVTIANTSPVQNIVVLSGTTKAELQPGDILTLTEASTIMIMEKK